MVARASAVTGVDQAEIVAGLQKMHYELALGAVPSRHSDRLNASLEGSPGGGLSV